MSSRMLGYSLISLAYGCAPLVAWWFYQGKWWVGLFILIVGLVYAGLHLLLWGSW